MKVELDIQLEKLVGYGFQKRRPPCMAKVRMSKISTHTKRHREYQAHRRGLLPEQCNRPSFWKLNGQCLCAAHAGVESLRLLNRSVTDDHS